MCRRPNNRLMLAQLRRFHVSSRPNLLVFVLFAYWPALLAAAEPNPGEKFLTVWAGTLPIIISAPHGGREPLAGVAQRRGVGVPQFVTGRDTRTDELAEAVAGKLAHTFRAKPFLVVARFERKYVDANRARHAAYESDGGKLYYDAYHDALGEACKFVRMEWGRGILLDIHGEGADPEAVFRGTNNGKTVQTLVGQFGQEAVSGSKSITGQLAEKGYKVFPPNGSSDKEQRYVGGFIVQNYGSHKAGGVDAIQLEFGTNLRQRAVLERTASDVASAVTVFVKNYLPMNRRT
ncbi:MAG: N-formylglutamate amidohydrolase, partial [Deltaproteobacteria bacterium]|nr:N-formylglutamate amidohydrolase [Deltaproteobacteria bacterium]